MRNILILLSFFIAITACVPDETEHNFKDLSEIRINGLSDSYKFNFLEESIIEPEIVTNMTDPSHLEYRWYMYTNTTRYVADTLSKEKNLKSIISATPGLEYFLVFSVKDINTGVVHKKTMTAEVFSELTRGTVLLVEEDGRKAISFIRPDKTILHNVYSNANDGQTLGENSNKILFVDPNAFAPQIKNIIVFSEDNDGGVILDPVDFKVDRTLRESFYQNPSATTLNTQGYANGTFSDYLIINGKIYNRAVNMGDLKWKPQLIIIDTSIENDYSLANVVINKNSIGYGGAVLYDDLNGRFLQHAPSNQGSLARYNGGSSTIFDYNNTGMKMLFSEETMTPSGYEGDYYFAICESKDDSSKRYLMKFLIGRKDGVSRTELHADQLIEISLQDNPGLYNATMYAADDSIKGVLWYSDGEKLYALNTSSPNPREIIVRDFSSEGISADVLKFYTYTEQEADGMVVEKTELRVAVRDNNLSTGKAGILYLKASTSGGINISEKDRIFGLGDKIIDFDEKIN